MGAVPGPVTAWIVVPCFNEEARLDDTAFLSLVEPGDLRLLFVNDGSRDGTETRLRALRDRRPERIDFLSLPRNLGKAEAVRSGMREALDRGAEIVGYTDADLSTPVAELRRLWSILGAAPRVQVLLASRVSLLGADIQRRAARHYLGRVFASLASLMLQLRVYDTQCGAKLFRRTPALEAALDEPFTSRWAFDVELLGRLAIGTATAPAIPVEAFLEVPLRTWVDVAGSKLRFTSMARTLVDLARVGSDLAKRRAAR
ncbi:MAG TPA: glycosyltransferase [Planctomycetota bacterium]|nr:glycosyltransferase [Planctomycetota bacterium]